ncbi:DNA-binding response regulator [Acrocarpospora phusangensis]|uniref:DNA-binding response regulator n=1 Tax=Acrocarpospora phusangensis TaxID=1070424 RepID=A0A919QC44_9ACTN|nr:response regulator transcription factor [Acrocarpospora phusangensis]GIH26474.1 DNA-binding response regulator [Acrocarpospora phusangensis]
MTMIVAGGAEPPRVLLADSDPISRHVLGGTLREAAELDLIAATDSRRPVREWPLREADLVVIVAGPRENHVRLVQELTGEGVRALLIGVDWTRHSIEAAFASDVCGCISKDWAVTDLVAAAVAAASGYVVLSPDLVGMCVQVKPMSPVGALESRLRALTVREREVLTLLAEGMTTAEVARRLTVSRATVKSHVSHVLTKVGARNRMEAVLLMRSALGCGLDP